MYVFQEVCRRKGEILMPNVFFGPMMNGILQMLIGKRFEHHKLRPVADAALRFLRSGDATGGALTITPWLRFIAPDFFGYSSTIDDNNVLRDFMRVNMFFKTFLRLPSFYKLSFEC